MFLRVPSFRVSFRIGSQDCGILARDIRTPTRAHLISSVLFSELLLLHIQTWGYLARRAVLALSP